MQPFQYDLRSSAATHTASFLNREAFTHNSFYPAFTQRSFAHSKLSHTASFFTQSFYTQQAFHTQQAFAHRIRTQCFYTWQAFTHRNFCTDCLQNTEKLHASQQELQLQNWISTPKRQKDDFEALFKRNFKRKIISAKIEKIC